MVKAHQKNNLTKARNHLHTHHEVNNTDSDLESDSDCGHEGGVDCDPSDDEYAYADSEEDWSDDESLAELEGDELEANLSALHEEAESWDAPNVFKVMMKPKNAKEWSKVEANRALGYTKNSTRTQERRRKEAHKWEAFRAEAKNIVSNAWHVQTTLQHSLLTDKSAPTLRLP
jgi:hypothetical protein